MKAEAFKNLIKSAVREVIQEELKDILLEALKSPNKSSISLYESPTPPTSPPPPTPPPHEELRRKYHEVLGETAKSFTTNDLSSFNPNNVGDPINGDLGGGEVGMDQIIKLLNTK